MPIVNYDVWVSLYRVVLLTEMPNVDYYSIACYLLKKHSFDVAGTRTYPRVSGVRQGPTRRRAHALSHILCGQFRVENPEYSDANTGRTWKIPTPIQELNPGPTRCEATTLTTAPHLLADRVTSKINLQTTCYR